MTVKAKIKVLESCPIPVLTYGAQTSSVIKKSCETENNAKRNGTKHFKRKEKGQNRKSRD